MAVRDAGVRPDNEDVASDGTVERRRQAINEL